MVQRRHDILRRTTTLGAFTGFVLALVVSAGIASQRMSGASSAALAANAATTFVALVSVLVTVRTYLTSFDAASFDADLRRARVLRLSASQIAGAFVAIALVHLALATDLATHPWLREDARQLVNDVVGVLGVLAFVWGCAQKPIRVAIMLAGLALVLGYELTSTFWHVDAPIPDHELARSVQSFVASEVTSSGIGLVVFRVLLA